MRLKFLLLALAFLLIPLVHAENITGVDGMAVFIDSSPGDRINYSIWNRSTASFGSNITSLDLGTDVKWAVLRSNPVRNEFLLFTQDTNDDAIVQIYNSSSWASQLNVSFDTKSKDTRQIDAAYESISGDAIIVYETSKSNDKLFGFRTWNGASWSGETNITTALSSEELTWVQAIPNPSNDNVMLVVHNDDEELYAILWNGTSIVNDSNVSITQTSTSDREHFAFAWESLSNDGLLVYGNGSLQSSEFAYRTFASSGNSWSSRSTMLSLDLNDIAYISRLCSDPTSDYIGFISQSSDDDINIRVWNGTGVESSPSPLAEDTTTEMDSDDGSVNLDCAWEKSGNQALFAFTDYNSTSDHKISYITYDKSLYSASDIESAAFSANISSGSEITYLDLIANPVQDDIMAITLDDDKDIRAIRWDGSSFNSTIFVLTTDAECSDTDSQCGSFAWRMHYSDAAPPEISLLTFSPNPVNANSTVYINATITDSTSVSSAILQVNFSNGTFTNYSSTAIGSMYYNSSVTTNFLGNASAKWFANDTLGNYNVSEIVSFAVDDSTSPSITSLISSPNPVIANQTVYVNATITDDSQLSTVILQANFTNGTFTNYSASNMSGNYFNSSITTNLVDNITIRFFANDTHGNANSTETSSFSVRSISDTTPPSITILSPLNNTNFTSTPIEFSFNAVDNSLSLNCSLLLDGSTNSTSSVSNNSNSSFSISSIADGNYFWKITCTDASSNQNSSGIMNFSKTTESAGSGSSGGGGGGGGGGNSGGGSRSSSSSSSSSSGSSEGSSSSVSSSSSSSGDSSGDLGASSGSSESASSLSSPSSTRITGAAVNPVGIYTGMGMIGMSFVTMAWAIVLMRKIAKRKKDSLNLQPQVYPANARKLYVHPVSASQIPAAKSEILEKKPEPTRIAFNELKHYFPQTLGNSRSYNPVNLAPSAAPRHSTVSESKRQAVYSMLDEMGIYTGQEKPVPRQETRQVIKKAITQQYPAISKSAKEDMLSRLKKAYS